MSSTASAISNELNSLSHALVFTKITTSSLLTGKTEKISHPTSLLDLPKEVRNRIWHFALRPDCMFLSGPNVCLKSHCHRDKNIGRWRILVLCSTIYNETVVLLRNNGELIVQLTYRGPPVFECDSYPSTWGGGAHAIRCVREIQVRQARNVAVIVHLGQLEHPDGHNRLSYKNCTAKFKLGDVLRTLKQAKDIRKLRLFIERRSEYLHKFGDWEKHFRLDRKHGILDLLLAIVREVACKGGEVFVGRAFTYLDEQRYGNGWEPLESHDDDPVVPWLVQAALREGVFITRLMDPLLNRPMTWEELRVRVEDRVPVPDVQYQDPLQRPFTYEELLDENPATPSAMTFGLLESDIKDVRELTGRRQMVPQCNIDCQRTFGSMQDFENHLSSAPDHRMSFTEVMEAEATRAARLAEANEEWQDAKGCGLEEDCKEG
ncbi:uncharacterized protein AB675_2153 [Cyphellophora attinorum]|uniref:Uncharacterized protein n=1 Tax=Cyphellophora attinorum TaxID=1664694 RepID=A0A0N0NPH1_9EURO|nr:uncharacterized protein AB675_2153 [Phialophora attinorum]KPI42718.1 hypothetical protein AB675_2153 [Phialophora attinorum]